MSLDPLLIGWLAGAFVGFAYGYLYGVSHRRHRRKYPAPLAITITQL